MWNLTSYQTHNVALIGPIAEFVVSLGLDGSVQTQGTDISSFLENHPRTTSEVEQKAPEHITKEKEPKPKATSDGKLVVAEEIVEGRITWESLKLLMSSLGGNHPILFFAVLVGWLGMGSVMITVRTWFLGVWGSAYEDHPSSEVPLSL